MPSVLDILLEIFLYIGWPTKLFVHGQTKKIDLRHSLYWFWIDRQIRNEVIYVSLPIMKYHKFRFLTLRDSSFEFNHYKILSSSLFMFSDNCSVCTFFTEWI